MSTSGSPRRTRALQVDITPDDEAWAKHQNRYQCLIVRAIQRGIPDALRVRADTKEIAFSLPGDGPGGTRYFFETPPEVVRNIIRPFDEHQPITQRSFTLTSAYAAEPMRHKTRDDKIKDRVGQRRRRSASTKSNAVHNLNRFLDYAAEENITEVEEAAQ